MTDNLQGLIRDGKLRPGTKLHHTGRRFPPGAAEAKVEAGGIRLHASVYRTPSAAARAITGKPVDGWAFWKLPDGKPLDSLRSERSKSA
jgi:hypothetical protein